MTALKAALASHPHPAIPATLVRAGGPAWPDARCGAARDGAVNMLDISVTAGESGPVLVLEGEADLTTLAQLNHALGTQLQAGARLLTVDLSRLRSADPATAAILVAAARSVHDQGGRLELLRPRPAVARVLRLTDGDRALTVRGEPGAGPRPAREPAPDKDRAAPLRLRVLLGNAGGDKLLQLAGEADFTTISVVADAVDRCLRDQPVRITVDLHGVTFCDCAAARALSHAQRRAAATGISFRLTGLTPPVRRVLTLMHATDLLRAAGEPA